MKLRLKVIAVFAAVVVVAAAIAAGAAAGDGQGSRDTSADFSPGDFLQLNASSECEGEESGPDAEPFVLADGFSQQVVDEENPADPSNDNWDMNTQNETGKDAGRYIYRTHEQRVATGSEVTVTDLQTGEQEVLMRRQDWDAFDGIVWTPEGTILAAEEFDDNMGEPDPEVPEARAGLVYEFFIDPDDPTELDPDREPESTDDGVVDLLPQDGVRARPALGSKAHEGMRFDDDGNVYGISEDNPGSIFRFAPEEAGDLSEGQLQALKTDNGEDGRGEWVDLEDEEVLVNAQDAATEEGANTYDRPEDVETGESTGRDRNNGGDTLYVAITGTDEVLAVDIEDEDRPFAYDYVSADAGNVDDDEFVSADNLALDSEGNLAITEDISSPLVAGREGDDLFIASPPDDGDGHDPAENVERVASLKDCIAEPTGIYFAHRDTADFTGGEDYESTVDATTLFVNRQHAEQFSPIDQLVAIHPDARPGDDSDDGGGSNGRGRDDNDNDNDNGGVDVPGVLDAFGAFAGLDCALFTQNFGPTQFGRLFRCQEATLAVLAGRATNAQEACSQQRLSKRRLRGHRRSDYAACVRSIALSQAAVNRLL